MSDEKKKPLVVIVGPTAVGKTSASIELAKRLAGEVISADSRLLFRGMDIGTAKPTAEEMQGVQHHLIDVAEPDEEWSLAVYQRQAYRIIDDIHRRGKLPFLVGGTGQFIRSIIEGWQIPLQSPDSRLRQALNHWGDEIGAEALYERLKRLDPEAAEKIDYRNKRRTIRALEVIFKTGQRFSELRKRKECRYSAVIMGISRPRSALYARIDRRIEEMLKAGWVDEVRGLLAQGYPADLPTMSAIGYREIVRYLRDEITYEKAISLIKRNTRIFVRRQANWFKPDDPRITWFPASDDLVNEMEYALRRRLYEQKE
jgi:tRNA dimethylallyltransferase